MRNVAAKSHHIGNLHALATARRGDPPADAVTRNDLRKSFDAAQVSEAIRTKGRDERFGVVPTVDDADRPQASLGGTLIELVNRLALHAGADDDGSFSPPG